MNEKEYGGNVIFLVEKLYEDGWKWYCGYPNLAEAKEKQKIVNERDKRETRIRCFVIKELSEDLLKSTNNKQISNQSQVALEASSAEKVGRESDGRTITSQIVPKPAPDTLSLIKKQIKEYISIWSDCYSDRMEVETYLNDMNDLLRLIE